MKINLYIIAILAIIFSCETDDSRPVETTNSGVDVTLNTTSISSFDTDHPMELEITILNLDINELTVTDANDLNPQTLTIVDNKALFNSSLFGSLAEKEVDTVLLDATLSNGVIYEKTYVVDIYNPISVNKSFDHITYKSSKADTLAIKTSTESAVIDLLSLEWKIGKEGTYQTDSNFSPLEIQNDTINFVSVDEMTFGYGLKLKDTLYYKIIATSGTLKDSLEINIPILPQKYNVFNTSSISTNALENKFNLLEGNNYPDIDTENGEIKSDANGLITKEGETNIVFVQISDISSTPYSTNTELLEAEDALTSKELFEANTEIDSFTPNAANEMFGYKITRLDEEGEEVIAYGLILVTDITEIESISGLSTTYNFIYGEGTVD